VRPSRSLTFYTVIVVACLLVAPITHGQSGAKLSGVVSDQSGGIIPGAFVYLISPVRARDTKTNEDGHFEFAGLPPETYYLEVKSPGFKTGTLDDIRIVDKDMETSIILMVGEGSGLCVTQIDVAPAMRKLYGTVNSPSYEERVSKTNLIGIVHDVTGISLSNLRIYLSSSGQSRAIIANKNGEFRIDNLEPGKYTLKVSHDGYRGDSQDFWIARQSLTRVTFFVAREKPCR
jgi:hypothetical protein